MYKIIIAFTIAILILAIGMRQCNDDDTELESGVNPEQVDITKDNTESKIEKKDDNKKSEPETKKESLPSEDYKPGLETPQLTIDLPEQILIRKSYSVSYNKDTKCPNWVAWHLTSEHTDGPISRRGIPYIADNEIKGPRQEVEDWDSIKYIRIWDHGHMCPAGDNKWDRVAMEESFLLSNFCPQNQQLNGGDWRILEEKCRKWANKYADIYIACGPIYFDSLNVRKLKNKIWIPDAFYKVILCLNKTPKAIGFICPNVGEGHSLDHYAVSVDRVEEITGIDFFFILNDTIENNIEAIFNFNEW